MEKLIINYTPTGMVPLKKDSPHVPLSVQEIVDDVIAAYNIGITMVHLHARNPDTLEPDYNPDIYGRIMEKLEKYIPECIICFSLSGRKFSDFGKRSAALDLMPDLASLTLSSLNFSSQASINSPSMINKLLEKMNKNGVKPELEIFDLGMLNYAKYLIKKDLISPPFYFNCIFGNIASIQPELNQIGALMSELPHNSYTSFGGIGKFQFNTHLYAMASGMGVRVGLEDNLYFDKGRKKLATNHALLQRIHLLAEIAERPILSSLELGRNGFYNTQRRKEQSDT